MFLELLIICVDYLVWCHCASDRGGDVSQCVLLLCYVAVMHCCNALLQCGAAMRAAVSCCNALLQCVAAMRDCNALLQCLAAMRGCNGLLQCVGAMRCCSGSKDKWHRVKAALAYGDSAPGGIMWLYRSAHVTVDKSLECTLEQQFV